MRQKKTEAPFSGEYDALYPDEGFFKCAGCSRPLYSARAKFNSGCGWPAYVLFLFMDVFFGSPDVLSRLRFLVSLSCVRGAPL